VSASVLDPVLALAIVGLAWAALASHDLFRGVVLYIVFGLTMALAWARLRAPDIALAEAAVGAGLTGALLLDAVARLGRNAPGSGPHRTERIARVIAPLAVASLGILLVLAVLELPRDPGGLTALIEANLERSGVANPVTGVLLAFRAFDTWLEVAVLLVAALAALSVRRADDLRDLPVPRVTDPMLAALPRVLVPLMVLAAGYLFWLGTRSPGGAFQAGAVLASAGVLLLLAGRAGVDRLPPRALRLALTAGVIAFLAAALAPLAGGRRVLELDPASAGTVIVLVESAITLSIAVTLALLFAGARGAEDSRG
jgi:multisubunit Na+/H+ antiporter MnhB subunit